DIDLAGSVQAAFLQEAPAIELQRAIDRDLAAIDAAAVERKRRSVIDRDLAKIGDVGLHIQRAARQLDGPGVRDAGLIAEVTTLSEVQRPAIDQHALAEELRRPGDINGPRIVDDRIRIEAEPAGPDRQLIDVDQLR